MQIESQISPIQKRNQSFHCRCTVAPTHTHTQSPLYRLLRNSVFVPAKPENCNHSRSYHFENTPHPRIINTNDDNDNVNNGKQNKTNTVAVAVKVCTITARGKNFLSRTTNGVHSSLQVHTHTHQ